MVGPRVINFDQGWEIMQEGIAKLVRIVERLPEPEFEEEPMMLYTTIYNMCTQKPPHDYSRQLYHKFHGDVLPSLREEHDESMLREFVKRWANHKVMVRWLKFIFGYLDHYFIRGMPLPSLNEVGFTCFRDLVYQEVYPKVTNTVITLVLCLKQHLLTINERFLLRKNSRRDYLTKIGECLEQEKDRADHYFHPTTVPKLLEKVETIRVGSLSCM